MTSPRTVQVRVVAGRQIVGVEGPDDAEAVVTIDRRDAPVEPSVAFMTGRLKVAGSTGALLDALADGRVAAALSRLASPV